MSDVVVQAKTNAAALCERLVTRKATNTTGAGRASVGGLRTNVPAGAAVRYVRGKSDARVRAFDGTLGARADARSGRAHFVDCTRMIAGAAMDGIASRLHAICSASQKARRTGEVALSCGTRGRGMSRCRAHCSAHAAVPDVARRVDASVFALRSLAGATARVIATGGRLRLSGGRTGRTGRWHACPSIPGSSAGGAHLGERDAHSVSRANVTNETLTCARAQFSVQARIDTAVAPWGSRSEHPDEQYAERGAPGRH